jgi:hypothetical protein
MGWNISVETCLRNHADVCGLKRDFIPQSGAGRRCSDAVFGLGGGGDSSAPRAYNYK